MARTMIAILLFITVITKVVGLPDQAFWDNDWPSDLVPVGAGNDASDSFTFPSSGLEHPYVVQGQTNLDEITDAASLAAVFNDTPNQEVEVRTWNGAWIGDVYLPDDTQIENKSKFQLTVSSSWGVRVHYDGTSTKIENGETLILALLKGSWLDEDGYRAIETVSPTASPTQEDEKVHPDVLKGTVLFAQSQIIPSKHGHEGDSQPHLVSMRKTLVMLKPTDFVDSEDMVIEMTVKDKDGTVLGDGPISMEIPENIPKHDSFIDLGGVDIDDVDFPTSLDDPHVVEYQTNLDAIGNDEDAVGLTAILNDTNEQVEIKTWDGSWVKNIYFPKSGTIPEDSKIQISCNSGYSVHVFYPLEEGGWRSKAYSRGDTEISILVNGMWMAENDLEHNEYIFGHGFYTATLNKEWVQPGMTLEFTTMDDNDEEYVGILGDIDVGGFTELIITTLDAGFLTPPRDKFTFKDDFTTHREYFETAPLSRLIVVQYETMHFTEIMLPDGKLYTDVSDDDGGWHSGDMRQFIGKILLSHGIDLANYGINSSHGSSEGPHPFTCALLAGHNTVGHYQNGIIVHGGSGGNGMITLDNSIGNEFSHEVGHNYGLGHYVDGFRGSVHRPASEINSSWGWDSETNTFTPNFSQVNSGSDQCLYGECQAAYLGKYKFGTDSMAGGSPNYSNRFTLYTPNTSRIIQDFLESKLQWSESSSTGFRKFNTATKEMEESINNDNDNRIPSKFHVPVTTIVGFYEPDSGRGLTSYIYPALHGAFGFVYEADGDAESDVGCKLIVNTVKQSQLVYALSSTVHSSTHMNKFHVNVATEDEPFEASIYCDGVKIDSRDLDAPTATLEYTVTGVPLESCEEPTGKVELFFGEKRRYQTCDWYASHKKFNCKKVQVQDACPVSCELCEPSGSEPDECQDTSGKIVIYFGDKRRKKDCDWYGGHKKYNCDWSDVQDACPATCGLCED